MIPFLKETDLQIHIWVLYFIVENVDGYEKLYEIIEKF